MSSAAPIRRMPRGLWCAALLALCLAAGAGTALAAEEGASPSRLFGTMEFKGAITKLPKWTGVLDRMKGWKGFFEDPSMAAIPARQSWQALKGELGPAAPMDRVKAVNAFFNKWPYRLDQANYGTSDHWAAPPEFMKKSGDCEDYSIAKFYALKELGFSGDDMRIVALKDTIRNIGHAVLVVYMDGDAYVLDNQTVMVLSHARYKHYLPQYSVNEKYRWMHVPPTKNTTYSKKK